MEISLRFATPADLKVINERYAEIDFVPSHAGELIVLASIDEKIIGQGRVVGIDANSGELGGIYVFPGNEGLGIARKVVDFLIKNSVHDKFHRTLILSGFCLLKIAKIS
ncbi:GNAT family N-acetyltransferase, partial [Acinetobacter baumannii]|uniref:GNAT family N-acetyltransferase n=3 Tax=Acinetobacter baumannii TaxID=470 RepID=UPI0037563BBC